MPRLKSKITDRSEPDPNDAGGYGEYTGKMPPVGAYRCRLKFLRIALDKNGDDRWNGPLEIAEKGRHKQYNGYTMWVGQSFTEHPRSKAYMGSLAAALGVSWNDLLDKVIVDKTDYSKANPASVTKIGRVKIDNNELIVITRMGKDQDGTPRLEPSVFKPKDWEPEESDEDDDDDVDDDDVDDEEYDDDEEDEESEPEDDGEDSDEEEDDEEDEDEEEEPEPPKRSSKKSTPAKRPAKKAATKRRRAADDDDDEGDAPF